jgi:sugar/nucleoside kinase (ribokinase family)/nucleoside 2-deoxyribosyltransferase
MVDVLVIGGVYREALPPAHDRRYRIGGSGFVAALAASRLGLRVALASYVGQSDAQATVGPLRRAGIDTSYLQVMPGRSGHFVFSDPTDRMAPTPMYRPAEATPTMEAPSNFPTALTVLAFGFPDFDPFEWIKAATTDSTCLLWDRQGWLSRRIEPWAFTELPASRRIYLANLQELQEEANQPTYSESLETQPSAGFSESIVKCGRWGTLAFDGDFAHMVPAFSVSVRNAIGSGDCFAGVLAASLTQGEGLVEATTAAAAAASVFVAQDTNIPPLALTAGIAHQRSNASKTFVSSARLERTYVYLAGPFFTEAEARLVGDLEAALDHMGLSVISPRREIGELAAAPTEAEVLQVGRDDLDWIRRCDLIVAILDGDDPGTLMEVGFAAEAGIEVIALRSTTDAVPQPIREALDIHLEQSVAALIEAITEWARRRHGI